MCPWRALFPDRCVAVECRSRSLHSSISEELGRGVGKLCRGRCTLEVGFVILHFSRHLHLVKFSGSFLALPSKSDLLFGKVEFPPTHPTNKKTPNSSRSLSPLLVNFIRDSSDAAPFSRLEAAKAFDEARLLVGPHGDAMVPGWWHVGPAKVPFFWTRYTPGIPGIVRYGWAMGNGRESCPGGESALVAKKGSPVNAKVWKVFFWQALIRRWVFCADAMQMHFLFAWTEILIWDTESHKAMHMTLAASAAPLSFLGLRCFAMLAHWRRIHQRPCCSGWTGLLCHQGFSSTQGACEPLRVHYWHLNWLRGAHLGWADGKRYQGTKS